MQDNVVVEVGDGKFLQRIINRGHLSVIEHASATFRINEISRACANQLVRHRHFSFSQKSQRYTVESNMIIPDTITGKARSMFLKTSKIISSFDNF